MRFWNSAPPADLAEAGGWAAHLADMQRRLGYAQWRVSERAGDRLVGIAGLQPLDGGPEVELTYALEPSRWGAGYATEAAAAALDYAFTDAGLERVVAIAKPENAGVGPRAREARHAHGGYGRVLGQGVDEVRADRRGLARGTGGGRARRC